jgi:hypothetical protein
MDEFVNFPKFFSLASSSTRKKFDESFVIPLHDSVVQWNFLDVPTDERRAIELKEISNS